MSEFDQIVQEGKQGIKKRLKRLGLYAVLIGILGLAGYFLVCNYTYSKGTRIGYVMKISYKGMIFKTFEGTLNLATRNDLAVKTWDFSVSKGAIYDQISNSEGSRVKLYYRQKLKVMPWQGKTEYLVYKVDPVKD
ncbi:MAG: hypothetical protein IPN20_10920 [Haliscomenobacter sp.]|nr:hypothetical protein [Haliscomenobacter sp.]MBP9872980.1 hypothetical protein [Haliscomenobacter sp.]